MSKRLPLLIIALFLGTVGVFVVRAMDTPALPLVSAIVSEVQSTPSPSPTPESVALVPQTLIIPKLGVEVPVEHVGLDEKKRMDVPQNEMNVAWFQSGPKIGEVGSVVIAGHFDTRAGGPAVFYELEKLNPGDEVIVEGDDGDRLTYEVESTTEYPDAEFPVSEVFGRADDRWLNLITCSGTFNTNQKNYSHRRVVSARLKS